MKKAIQRVYSFFIILFVILFVTDNTISAQIYQWRGPFRNGIYPDKGLKKTWPANGPELIWSFEGLGAGHGGAGIGADKIFVLGMPDSTGMLYAFDFGGKLVWKKKYGPEWSGNYMGSRSTPVVSGDHVYFESGQGTIFCYNCKTGEKVWSVDLLKRFNARNITWGMAESVLIIGDTLYCTPGGSKNNIAALNRFKGESIWTSPGNGEPAAYCSAVYVKHNNTSLIVTMTAESIIGIDAKTGQFYWQVPQYQYNKIHANTPVYSNGMIYCASEFNETKSGLVALKLSNEGKKVTTVWRNENFRNLMGGIILKDGYIYGSIYQRNTWCCIDPSDGRIVHSFRGFGDGIIILADGLFYCYSEKGELALMAADEKSFRLISKFRIPLGSGPHWSHPVIYGGRLYLRHDNALMVYDIKG